MEGGFTLKKIILVFFIIINISIPSYATNEIIEEQMEVLNISDFINEAEEYTEDAFPNLNINELLNSAINGQVDNKSIFSSILSDSGYNK